MKNTFAARPLAPGDAVEFDSYGVNKVVFHAVVLVRLSDRYHLVADNSGYKPRIVKSDRLRRAIGQLPIPTGGGLVA